MKLALALLLPRVALGGDVLVDVLPGGEVALGPLEAALEALYGRRMVGYAAERSNYTYATCTQNSTDNWWNETLERELGAEDEFDEERAYFQALAWKDEADGGGDDDFVPGGVRGRARLDPFIILRRSPWLIRPITRRRTPRTTRRRTRTTRRRTTSTSWSSRAATTS